MEQQFQGPKTVKVYLGSEIRRWQWSVQLYDLSQLRSRIEAAFQAQLSGSVWTLKWKDEDNDLITIGDTEDLIVAVQSSPDAILRLFVTLAEPASEPAQAQHDHHQRQPSHCHPHPHGHGFGRRNCRGRGRGRCFGRAGPFANNHHHQHAERQHAQQQQQQQQQQHANANGSGDAKGPKDVPPFLKPWVDTLQQFAKETLGIDDVNIDVLVDHPFLKAMFQDPATAASPGHDACFRGKQRGGCHPFFFFHPPTQVSQQEEPSSTTKPTTATTTRKTLTQR